MPVRALPVVAQPVLTSLDDRYFLEYLANYEARFAELMVNPPVVADALSGTSRPLLVRPLPPLMPYRV